MRRWPEKAHIKEVLLPCFTLHPLCTGFPNTSQGTVLGALLSPSLCSELFLCCNHFEMDLTNTRNVTSHASKDYVGFFFFSHSSILIFKLILAESCSTFSFPLPLAGEYNNSVILLTVESYGIWDCYWRALFYKVKLRLGGLLFKFSSSLQNNYPKTQKKLKTHTSNQNDYVISQRATLQNNKFLCIF